MKKEEVIKEAWGIAYEEVKGMLIENGYIAYIDLAHSSLNLSVFGLDLNYNNIGVRPVSLQGIENNNGWIKIESEDDLPEIGTYCHFIIKGFEELNNKGLFDGMFWDNKCAYIPSIVTHYQPIEKPKPPIY